MFSARFIALITTAALAVRATPTDVATKPGDKSAALEGTLLACNGPNYTGCDNADFIENSCTALAYIDNLTSVKIPSNWICKFWNGFECRGNHIAIIYGDYPDLNVFQFDDDANSFSCFHYYT
ncbi:hypothetical protein B0H11DRAFT_2358574 [Mycena galericulata]|nr:hypothetical protein B0H11DRAFT_2358574 [Mycena galericulata]